MVRLTSDCGGRAEVAVGTLLTTGFGDGLPDCVPVSAQCAASITLWFDGKTDPVSGKQ